MAENCFGDESTEGTTVKRADLDGMSPGVAVSAAVAARTGENVLDLDSLSNVVDVDVLDAVWGNGTSGRWDTAARVTFPYMGFEVSVTAEELRVVSLAEDRERVDGGEVVSTDGNRHADEDDPVPHSDR